MPQAVPSNMSAFPKDIISLVLAALLCSVQLRETASIDNRANILTTPTTSYTTTKKGMTLNTNTSQPKPTTTLLPKEENAASFTGSNTSMYDDYDELTEGEMENCAKGHNPIERHITMVLYALVCIIGLFGNTLVIYVVLRFSKMQTVTNIYILNLAIADECFLIGIPFLLYTMQIGSWKFGEYMCKAYMVSTSITQFTSSIFLLIMSADRYVAVCHPISSQRYRTPFVSKVVSGIAWLTSVLLMVPVILFANTVRMGEHISCNIKWPEAQNIQTGTTFILYSLTLGFATPLAFILTFYCLVIRKLHTLGPMNKSKEKKRSHRKVTKLVLTVITVYILCWLPYWISQVALIASSPSQCASRLEITAFLLAGCLAYSNSAMNPLLYAFLSDNFKKSFKKAFICAPRKDVNAQLQSEHSIFPRWHSKKRKAQQHQRRLEAARRRSSSNSMTLLATSTACGTCITATTTIVDPISEVADDIANYPRGTSFTLNVYSENEAV